MIDTAPRVKLSVPTDDGSVRVMESVSSRGRCGSVVVMAFMIFGTNIASLAL